MTLRDWPIRRKFFVGTLAVTMAAIVFVSIVLIAAEFRSVRAARLSNTEAFVGMIARNAGTAVIFDDPIVAQQILSGITADPNAEAAALYDAKGKLYAKFPTNLPPSALPRDGRSTGIKYTGAHLEIMAEIPHKAGTAFLRMNLEDMQQRLLVYVTTVTFISLTAALLVLLLSRVLEQWIVAPILELAETAHTVAARGDYSLRARKRSADEVGGLVDAFNQMLDETQRSQNERQRAASALGQSEERLRLAQQVARIGTFEWNIQTGKNIWTPQLEEMHGLGPGTFAGTQQGWEQLVHEDDRARMVQRVRDALQTGIFADEWRVVWPDGTVHWIAGRGSVFKDADGKPLRLLGVNIDVTERRQAEEALRESEERFRSMADNIAPLAWMANADGWIFFYNKRWFEYTGTTLEEMQGWGWEKVHHPDHVRRVMEKWNDHLRRGEVWEDTFPLRGSDGRYRWFLSRAFPIRNAQGEITRWFGSNTDVTELRETQEALERAQAQLQQHAAELEATVAERTVRLRETIGELEAFSYSIAHDMRAPLRSMVGFSGILNADYADRLDASGKDFLRRIAVSAERLDRLIQDVLNYSKVVRGDLRLERIDTAKLIGGIIESYPNLQPPHAEIIIEGTLPEVPANPGALTQVISNLLGNAVKFVAKGVKPHVIVRAEDRGERVRFWFEDNGIGIDTESQKRLFQMFTRVHHPELYEGTGIGLAIVRKAVERMGGNVGVESEVNRGSRFWVELRKAVV